MFEGLKNNLKQEKKIVADMRTIEIESQKFPANRNSYALSLKSLAEQLGLLNATVPELLKERDSSGEMKGLQSSFQSSSVSPASTQGVKVQNKDAQKKVVKVSYVSPGTKEKKFIGINKEDRADFLKKLKFSEGALANIRKDKDEDLSGTVRKANAYAVFSSKYFREYSDRFSRQFEDIGTDLKNANLSILLSSYLSMAIMSSVIAFAFGFLIFLILVVFSLSNWIFFLLPFGFVGLVLAGFYLYPSSEASTVQKNITYELPFATIHMAAIAGSNITPVKIFKIIAKSSEYPNVGAELRKVVTQIEVYGYDIITSLKSVAKTSPNKKFSELLSGLATNISSGGALKNYLEKKSQSFLVDYRLEREKYSALAGTFMDVYISLLIAAPLVLMMMFIVMNVSGLGIGGLGITSLMFLSVGAIIITNIIFIVVLNIKQPKV